MINQLVLVLIGRPRLHSQDHNTRGNAIFRVRIFWAFCWESGGCHIT